MELGFKNPGPCTPKQRQRLQIVQKKQKSTGIFNHLKPKKWSTYFRTRQNITLTLLIGLLILSCSKKEKELEGDLYFKLVDFGSFYEADDKTIEKFEKTFDSIRRSKIVSKDELELVRVYDILKANDLIKSPWINLKTESEIKRIYLSESEYEKLKQFDRNKLISDNKKVELKIKVIELDSGIYHADKISDLKIVDGKTYWRK